jgi:hypothetical protein
MLMRQARIILSRLSASILESISRGELYAQALSPEACQSKHRTHTNSNIQARGKEMDTAILSASAGLVGSLIGGISTFAASWVTQHKLLGSQTRVHNARQRQELYSEFIVEATKRLAEAWNHQAEGPEVVTNLYSAVQRMRLVSSSRVVNCAEEVMRGVIAAYVEPNRTFDELRQLVQQGSEEDDYLREFTDACRQELSSTI